MIHCTAHNNTFSEGGVCSKCLRDEFLCCIMKKEDSMEGRAGRTYKNAVTEPKREGQIPAGLNRLNATLSEVESLTDNIHNRLSTVLLQPAAEPDIPKSEQDNLVPMAEQIRNFNYRIDTVRDQLLYLLNNMEI